MQQDNISEHDTVSRNKKNDGAHESLLTSFNYEGNGKQLTPGVADNSLGPCPKQYIKQSHIKSVKAPSSSSSSKRARLDKPESSICSYLSKCTSAEKSRVIRQKCGQEGKRSDKKNFRTIVKTKFDSFLSKNGLVNSDSASVWNNAFENADELSLSGLLDGSYKCLTSCPAKVKKGSSVNEGILLSVRKACSVLQHYGAVHSRVNREAPTATLSSTTHDEVNKSIEELMLSSEIQDTCQAIPSDSPFYQPKDILERLALPPARDLDSLILDSGMPLVSLQKTTTMSSCSLPPFPWSFSHSGSCKLSVDGSKSATNRNSCQGRWVRIGSTSSLVGDDIGCFSETDLKIYDRIGYSARQNLDDLSEDVKIPTMDCRLPYDKHIGMSCKMTDTPNSYVPDIQISRGGFDVLSSNNLFNLNFMAINVDSSDSHKKISFDNSVDHKDMEAEGNLWCQENETNMQNPSVSNLKIQEITITEEMRIGRDVHNGTDCNCYYPCKSTVGGCEQCLWHLPTPRISYSDYSPRLLAAAEIICDMARHSDVTRKGNHNSGKIRWPTTPSETAMKTRKSRSSMGKTDAMSSGRITDLAKSTNQAPSPQHKPIMGDSKSKTIWLKNVGREPAKWSHPIRNTFPRKSERNLTADTRLLHGSPVRLVGQAPSPTPAERGKDGHSKHRREIVTTASLNAEGIFGKDWGRGRSKRD